MDGLNFKRNGEVTDLDGNHVGFHDESNATELFDRCTRFATLEENLAALQEGIYGA